MPIIKMMFPTVFPVPTSFFQSVQLPPYCPVLIIILGRVQVTVHTPLGHAIRETVQELGNENQLKHSTTLRTGPVAVLVSMGGHKTLQDEQIMVRQLTCFNSSYLQQPHIGTFCCLC